MVKRSIYKGNTQQQRPRGRKVSVQEKAVLLPFLVELLKDQSRSSVKALLSHGQISVNGKATSQFDALLEPNDVVMISYERGKAAFSHPLLSIVWEDADLIVVNKREGLLSVATAKVKERTAYHLLSDYVKKEDPRNKIFVLHRLDRETSGLMMFARNRGVQEKMQSDWSRMITERSYVAVVEGRPEKEADLLVSNLAENAGMQVYVVAEGGKEAITRYKLLRSNDRYSLLELSLETGRKNQIRAQLNGIGHPIAGDMKYGATSNPGARLMLHARKLFFIHPVSGEYMRFETQVPSAFMALVK